MEHKVLVIKLVYLHGCFMQKVNRVLLNNFIFNTIQKQCFVHYNYTHQSQKLASKHAKAQYQNDSGTHFLKKNLQDTNNNLNYSCFVKITVNIH